jgi:hypothetical protein
MKKIYTLLFVVLLTVGSVSGQFSGGAGTSSNPYQIANATDLAGIVGSYVNGGFHFIQTADITLSGSWTSIGTQTTQFFGVYNGNGFTISGLLINDGLFSQRGLFGVTNVGSEIKNLGLLGVSITRKDVVGALIGFNRGTVTNCYSTGTVTGENLTGGLVGRNNGVVTGSYSTAAVNGFDNTGGLVGQNYGQILYSYNNSVVKGRQFSGGLVGESSGTISFCYSGGTLSPILISTYVGGFVGRNSGIITQSYSTANISSKLSGMMGGGFVGENSGQISNSYTWGKVELSTALADQTESGGFVATNNSGTISNSYSIGVVRGTYKGGFSAVNYATITNCFWNTETSLMATSDGGVGKNTVEMRTIDTYLDAGWNFNCEIWGINIVNNNRYPFLIWQNNYAFVSDDCNYWTGSTSNEWTVSGNWTIDVPTSGQNALIRSSSTQFPIVNSIETINTINVGTGAQFTVASSGNFTSTGRFVNEGLVTIKPGGALTCNGTLENFSGVNGLILESNSSGTASLIHSSANVQATVQRYIAGNKTFHLISTPVSGQTIQDFLSTHHGIIDFNATQNIYAMRHYNAGVGWAAYYAPTQSGNLVPGTAYTVGFRNAGTLTFKGALTSSNQMRSITDAGNGWNGIGNPFASSLNANNGINSFLGRYSTQLNDGAYMGLYVWVPSLGQYLVINGVPLLEGQDYLALAQGFLVKSRVGGGNVTFETAMRAHTGQAFFKSEKVSDNWSIITLKIKNAVDKTLTTSVAFNEDMTEGLDVGFDAGLYTDNQNFKLFSRMPNEISSIDLAVQALPNSWQEKKIIPLGIVNKEVGPTVFSISSMIFPSEVSILLEDRELNVFVDLTSENYTINIPVNSNPIGRFYLHVGKEVTSVPDLIDISLSLNIYPNPSNGTFNVDINLNKSTVVEFELIDVSGRSVMRKANVLYHEGDHTVSFNNNNLMSGVYILRARGYDLNSNTLHFETSKRVLIR